MPDQEVEWVQKPSLHSAPQAVPKGCTCPEGVPFSNSQKGIIEQGRSPDRYPGHRDDPVTCRHLLLTCPRMALVLPLAHESPWEDPSHPGLNRLVRWQSTQPLGPNPATE